MAVIAVYSVKGGVGKTTIATNLAWFSATISCRRTLLWDLDASGGSGFLFDVDSKGKAAAERLFSRDIEPDDLIRKTRFARLDVLPADESLRELATLLARLQKRRRLAKLSEKFAERYERIIIDCPPVLNEISAQVIRAATCVIVPIPPSPLSARAFKLVAREIAANAKRPPPLLPVLSMVDRRRKLHCETLENYPDWPLVPLASAVEQCAVRQQPVGEFAPNSPAARALGQLWTSIERKLIELKSD